MIQINVTSAFITPASASSLTGFKTKTQPLPKPMFLRRRLCVIEKWLRERGSRVLLLPAFCGAILPQGFTGRQGQLERAGGSWKGQGAAGKGRGLAQMCPCEAKLEASMQTAGEPASLRARGTTANLCDAFAPSIFKKEGGKKTFKSSEPFLIFQLCEKESYPLGTGLNSGVFLWEGAVQRHVPVVDPCGRSVCAGAHMVPCSSHVTMDGGTVLHCYAIDKQTSGHRNDTKPA